MGGLSIFHLIGVFVMAGAAFSILRATTGQGTWLTQKLVLRGHHISFEPLPEGGGANGFALSTIAIDLFRGEPAFAVLIGRPAGLINFLREGVGLSRRFEFVLSQKQAVSRFASFTTHSVHCAKLEGLNSVDVTRRRPNPIALIGPFAVAFIAVSFLSFLMTGGDDSDLITGGFLAFTGCALYYLTQRMTQITFREAGNPEIRFQVYPPILERIFGRPSPELPLEDANRIIQIFRVLKDA
jgi:hypothetical protein